MAELFARSVVWKISWLQKPHSGRNWKVHCRIRPGQPQIIFFHRDFNSLKPNLSALVWIIKKLNVNKILTNSRAKTCSYTSRVSKWMTERSGFRHWARRLASSFLRGTGRFGNWSNVFLTRCRQLLRSAHSLAFSKEEMIVLRLLLNFSNS